MLEVKGLSSKAGGFSLDDISLTVEGSQCHVIVGPTGSGKTMFLESIIGFRKALEGVILLDGKDIKDTPVEKRGFSYVPQDLAIFPHLTVEENILYGLKVRRSKDSGFRALTIELIDALRIRHLLKRATENLSGGERQRVALARALAPGYRYLLLDEPLSSLHEGMKRELWFLLKELQQKYRFTMLMITHDMEEAFFLGDTISIMINGKIHQTGRKRDIYHNPETLDVARFLGIRNLFEAEVIDTCSETLNIYCAELNTNLTVLRDAALPPDANVKENDKLIAGIRSEEVMILRHGYQRQNQDNLLRGMVLDVFEKGASHTILFLPERSQKGVEIEVPNYAFQKLNLRKKQDTIISLKGENIFLIRPA